MQYSRAEEILNSSRTIEVLYEGEPVWINSLNPDQQTAKVTLGASNKRIDVHVNELIENS
ncbi:H-type small acid-soluble spore protein [Desulfitibacter alkalitolerans]|uniref:H-type small acid-soluble spore protein n=1 Tax=Desulfitibacter alkalitolerans TaxID=264641 RepID=UPI000489A579|nr:H-type small acid-soluble spore protein [Desulfitibacter alkalitolerans]